MRQSQPRHAELERLREDWHIRRPGPLRSPGFHAVAIYRLSRALGEAHGARTLPIRAVRTAAQFLSQTLYGVDLPWHARVGRRLTIGHVGGIVIAADAIVGDDCLIRQNVTIGATHRHGRSPVIGNGVEIGAGAVIVGEITIGDGAFIGPNAVVTTDVPAGARVIAPASRIVRIGEAASPTKTSTSIAPVSTDVVMTIVRDVLDTGVTIEADSPLLSSGLIDSLSLVTLIEALESRLGIVIGSDAVDSDQFDTPRMIADTLSVETLR